MSLSKEQVKKIAQLVRLELTSEEEEKYSRQLSAILDYVDQLQELNLEAWSLEQSPHKQTAEDLRADATDAGRYQKQIIQAAPSKKDNFITVPAVFGEE